MRTATEDMAAKFLRQTGNTLSLLVQYNPEGEKSHLTEKINQRPLIFIDLILYLTLLMFVWLEYNRAADSSGESTGTSPMNSPESDTFRRPRKVNSKSSTHIRIPR